MKKQAEKSCNELHSEMMEAAEAAILGKGDGRISTADTEKILHIRKNNPGEVADRTLKKIIETYKHTPAALAMVQEVGLSPHIPDWNETAEAFIQIGLSEIPGAGALLSSLTGLFWPQDEKGITSDEIWKAIQARVEAAVEGGLVKQTWINAQSKLTTLGTDLIAFRRYSLDDKYSSKSSGKTYSFSSVRGSLGNATDTFKKTPSGPSDKALVQKENLHLLPLFSKFATLHLSFLKAGYAEGEKHGMSPSTYKSLMDEDPKSVTSIPSLIKSYQKHINDTMKGFVDYTSDSAVPMPNWVEKYDLYMSEVEMYNHYLPLYGTKGKNDNITNPPYQVYFGPTGPNSSYYYHNAFKKFDGNSSASGMLSNIDITFDLGYGPSPGLIRVGLLKGLTGLDLAWKGKHASPMDCSNFKNISFFSPSTCGYIEGRNKVNVWIDGKNSVVQVKGHFDDDRITNISFRLKDGHILGPYGETNSENFSFPSDNNLKAGNPLVLSSIIMNQVCIYTHSYECSGLLFGFRKLDSYSDSQKTYATPAWDYKGVYKGSFKAHPDSRYTTLYHYPALYEIDSVSPDGGVTGSFMDGLVVRNKVGMVPFINGRIDFNTRSLKADNIADLTFTEENGEILLGGLKKSQSYHFADWGGSCVIRVPTGDVFHAKEEDANGVRIRAWSPGEYDRQMFEITSHETYYTLTTHSAYAAKDKDYNLNAQSMENGNYYQLNVWEKDQPSTQQRWNIIPTGKGDNTYYLQNVGTGYYVTPQKQGIYTEYVLKPDIANAVPVLIEPVSYFSYIKDLRFN